MCWVAASACSRPVWSRTRWACCSCGCSTARSTAIPVASLRQLGLGADHLPRRRSHRWRVGVAHDSLSRIRGVSRLHVSSGRAARGAIAVRSEFGAVGRTGVRYVIEETARLALAVEVASGRHSARVAAGGAAISGSRAGRVARVQLATRRVRSGARQTRGERVARGIASREAGRSAVALVVLIGASVVAVVQRATVVTVGLGLQDLGVVLAARDPIAVAALTAGGGVLMAASSWRTRSPQRRQGPAEQRDAETMNLGVSHARPVSKRRCAGAPRKCAQARGPCCRRD